MGRGGRGVALLSALLALLVATGACEAGQVRADIPDKIDPRARYLIFIQGPAPGEPVATAFADLGFEVVTERRPATPDPYELARKASAQVRKLALAGVTPLRIAVMGYDVGGAAALA